MVKIRNFDDYMGCFGDFNSEDNICIKYCALRLRCAIEQDQTIKQEILEDLIAYEGSTIKIQ